MSKSLRLQVYMSRCGAGSRRYCDDLIKRGTVRVNGKQVTRLGTKVSLNDQVTLNGKILKFVREKVYLAVNKPKLYLCSNFDPEGRPLVSDLFKGSGYARVFHVGRLDFLSSGLIFYTNDGNFAKIVAHPSFNIEKDYLVETKEDVPEVLLKHYRKGIKIGNEHFCLKSFDCKTENKILLTLVEGKNKEIRKVFCYYKITIRRVHRVRIGCVSVRGIPAGGFRVLTTGEIKWFLEQDKES